MAIHSYSQPSSTEPNSVTSQPPYYGFVDGCYCGGNVNLVSRPVAPHLGRLIYKCQNDHDGLNHCSKWWDKAVEDEIDSLKTRYLRMDYELDSIKKKDLANLQNEIDRLENIHQVVLREELDILKTSVKQLRTDMECWSASFDYLVDYYEGRSIRDFLLAAIGKLSWNPWILGLSVGLTLSLVGNIYMYVN